MTKYTIEDWEKEKFELIANKSSSEEWDKGSVEVTLKRGYITEREEKQIRVKQEFAYDKAVELSFEKEKKELLKKIKDINNEDLYKIINNYINIYQSKFKSRLHEYYLSPCFKERENKILEGIKNFKHIKGGEYLKVKKEYENFSNNKSFERVSLEKNSDYYLAYIYRLIKYLEAYNKKHTLKILKEHKELGEDHLKYLYNRKSDFDKDFNIGINEKNDSNNYLISEWYNELIIDEIDNRLENINDPEEKLKFIISEKKKFNKYYKGKSVNNIISFFEDCKDDIRWRIETKKKTKPKTTKQQITYQWQPETELPKVYDKLMSNEFIAPETTLEQFKAIFTSRPVNEIEPIKWTSKPVLLAYFIKQMCFHDKINEFKTNIWSIAEKCFIGIDKNKIKASYHRSLNNKTERPKNHRLIDDLF